MGCLFGLGQIVGRSFFGLGSFLTSILLRGVGYILLTVIGPLFLGSVREVIVRIMRVSNEAGALRSRWRIGSRTTYAILSGIVWVAAYLILRLFWQFLRWIVSFIFSELPPGFVGWFPPLFLLAVIFAVGLIVGTQVHRHDSEQSGNW
jgi:hypothetical protein